MCAEIKADLIPGTYKGAEYDGKIYGLAFFTGVFGLERNCEVIKQAGLDCDNPPKSWDELLAQVKTITEKGAGKYYGFSLQGPIGYSTGSVMRVSVFLNQLDALICQNNCTEPFFDNPKTVPVLEFIRQLNQYTPPGLTLNPEEGQVYTPLFEGKSAYQIAGSWHPKWAKDTGCKDCRYSTVPIPTGGHAASLVVGNVIYAIPMQAQHPELAKEWLRLMVSAKVQDQLFVTSGRLPATRSALTKLRPTVDSATQLFIDELLNNPNLTVLPQWKDPLKTWKVYNDQVLLPVLTTNRPIQEIIDQAQVQANKIGP
jgi:multiple sugar transport system substrate-binding protein